jgi:hypothetical protein
MDYYQPESLIYISSKIAFSNNLKKNKFPKILQQHINKIKNCCLNKFGLPIQEAVGNCHFHCFEKFIKNNYNFIEDICTMAVKYGDLETLKFWIEKDFKVSKYCIQSSFLLEKFDIIIWLSKNYSKLFKEQEKEIFSIVAYNGNFKILKWLYQNKFNFDEKACSQALCNKQFNVLKWLRYKNCPWDEKTSNNAILCCNLKTVKWLWENKCPFSENCCWFTFGGNRDNINCLKFLYEKGFNINKYHFEEIVKNEKLKCLEFVISKNCFHDNYCLILIFDLFLKKKNIIETKFSLIKNFYIQHKDLILNNKICDFCELSDEIYDEIDE